MVAVMSAEAVRGDAREPRRAPGRRRGVRWARLKRRVADNVAAYAFLAAGLFCFGFFSWYPLVRGILLSFQQDNLVTDPYWVGLDNFHALFKDPLFVTAWVNTLKFTGLALVLGYALPFVLALVLNELRHFRAFFRVTVYLPVMLPPIVTVLLWKYFYEPDSGLFNTILGGLHLPKSQWTQSPGMAMLSLVLVSTWANLGSATIIYLAGLQTIPGELYEAAELDGASLWQRIRYVTIPQLRFLLLVLLLLQIVATMQVFIEPFQLTGTTDPHTITVLVLVYRYAFTVNNDFGLAAAMSLLLFCVLGVFSALYLWLTREGEA